MPDRESFLAAEQALGAPIALPSHPSDLGLPDSVAIERNPVVLVTCIWNEADGDEARLVLQMIGAQTEILKYGVPHAVQVSVNSEMAVWLDTPHTAQIQTTGGRAIGLSWLVQSNVLVWIVNGVTYRIETELPLPDALRLAESLQPFALE